MKGVDARLEFARAVDSGQPPRYSKWCPHTPHPKQKKFMASEEREGLFGGAAGGGKSDALLMDVLQYADEPGFSALLVRKTYADLIKADALIPRAKEWLTGTGAKPREGGRIWEFPSNATLEFGYLDNVDDHLNFQSSAFQYIGIDELTQHRMSQVLYLFSRLRKLKNSKVPLKFRATTNPGGQSHDDVYERYIEKFEDELRAMDPDDRTPRKFVQKVTKDLGRFGKVESERFFIPSKLDDNPSLDQQEYISSLANLSPLELERLLGGDWDIRPDGENFKEEWFRVVSKAPVAINYVRGWDTSLTKSGDPTNSSLLAVQDRNVVLIDQTDHQTDIGDLLDVIVRIALGDPPGTVQAIEDSSVSKQLIHLLKTDPRLNHIRIVSVPVSKMTGPGQGNDKLSRASGWIGKLSEGEFLMVQDSKKNRWNDAFKNQCLRFTNEKHNIDGRIDSVSVAYTQVYRSKGLSRKAEPLVQVGSPKWFDDQGEMFREAQDNGGFFM